MTTPEEAYRVAGYARLSREDGDRLESDSIINQQHVIEDYCASHPGLCLVDDYLDDGCTGTNFNRPGFQRMLRDIEAGKINCVIVKDLSRFGRDYIDMGHYLERWFPVHGVRFIAINDGVDSLKGPYDMLLPLKNIFNTQYAKDISDKIRSSFRSKQRRGEFIGAFASYGYLKDPENHNHLVIDPVASRVVEAIFEMAAQGLGQVRIAKRLNEDGIPCPSEYKRLMGDKYSNSHKLDSTHYWTYATVHRMLRNEIYIGNMVSNRSVRPTMHGKAKANDRDSWIVVTGTHAPIISPELWATVQAQVSQNTRALDFKGNVSPFAGFLKCGDCGRALSKKSWGEKLWYSCGSYQRYGPSVCTPHYISLEVLEEIVLEDLNHIISAVPDLRILAEENRMSSPSLLQKDSEKRRLESALTRVQRLKQSSYEDYKDNLLSKDEFRRYKADYDRQEQELSRQLEQLIAQAKELVPPETWVDKLVQLGKLTELDRATLAQTVQCIRIFEDKRIQITYLFSENLRSLLEERNETVPAHHPYMGDL